MILWTARLSEVGLKHQQLTVRQQHISLGLGHTLLLERALNVSTLIAKDALFALIQFTTSSTSDEEHLETQLSESLLKPTSLFLQFFTTNLESNKFTALNKWTTLSIAMEILSH